MIPKIHETFVNYQNPSNVDKAFLAQQIVNETEVILHDSIKKLLERQGDLDTLVAKSNDLSTGAKLFYKDAKKWIEDAAKFFNLLYIQNIAKKLFDLKFYTFNI